MSRPPSLKCCDEHGWVVDARGLPVDPAVPCSRHPEKRAATQKPGQPATDAPDTRDGNKNKFAWFYEMLADPTVSLAAKVVGTGCCMKMAGRKGHFKATRKAIANLCGISQSTVRRGLADLIDKRFLEADMHEGAASTYYLILPAQRWEDWLDAEAQQWKDWLDAEKEHQHETDRAEHQIKRWLYAEKLHTEKQFRDAIIQASMARGADQDRAQKISDQLFRKFSDAGLDLDIDQGIACLDRSKPEVFVAASAGAHNAATRPTEPDHPRADPGTSESRPRYASEPTPVRQRAGVGTPESRPRLTPDAPTSENGQTHNPFKDSERPVKVFQELESDPALRNALNARPPRGPADGPTQKNARTCKLCGTDGIFRDQYGAPVALIDDDGLEYSVDCQHSMAANLAHIQRRENSEDRSLCRTGFAEIDSHYPEFQEEF